MDRAPRGNPEARARRWGSTADRSSATPHVEAAPAKGFQVRIRQLSTRNARHKSIAIIAKHHQLTPLPHLSEYQRLRIKMFKLRLPNPLWPASAFVPAVKPAPAATAHGTCQDVET